MLKEDTWIEPIIITSAIAGNICQSYFDSIENLNEPFAFPLGFTESLIFEAARENGCHVILDGMAGDLLFYSPNRSLDLILRKKMFSWIPAILAAYWRHDIDNGLRTIGWTLLRVAAPEVIRTLYRIYRDKRKIAGDKLNEIPGNLLKLLNRETARQFLATKHSQSKQVEGHFKLDNDQSAHARTFTSGSLSFAHEVDGQIALSKGVEPRSPFTDRRMIEFAIQMPVEAKLSAPWYKHQLRKSMLGILPEDVRWRKDMGGIPDGSFMSSLFRMRHEAPRKYGISRALMIRLAGGLILQI